MYKNFFVLVIVFIVLSGIISVYNQSKVATIKNCKVVELQQQQLISSENGKTDTEIRYLVVTDKETFVCESSLLNGKFNNSDIFWHLKKDSTYTFKVAGVGKSAFTEYRNILNVVK